MAYFDYTTQIPQNFPLHIFFWDKNSSSHSGDGVILSNDVQTTSFIQNDFNNTIKLNCHF